MTAGCTRNDRLPHDPITERFAHLVRAQPEAPLVCRPDRTATRAEIDTQAGALADMLSRQLPTDGLIALVAPNGPAFLIGFLAVLRVRLPAVLLDPLSPERERHALARALGAGAIVHTSCSWPEDPSVWQVQPQHRTPRSLPGIGVVKLTSGSTGQPRGVATRPATLLADVLALNRAMQLTAADRLLTTLPLGFSYGLSSLAVSALACGQTLVLPDGDHPLAPMQAAEALQATFFPSVPAFLQGLCSLAPRYALPASLRLVVSAGAPMPTGVACEFRQRFGQPVHVFYGASECGGICYDRAGSAAERGTVGPPIEGVEVDITADGSVRVRSDAVGDGYLDAGGSTAFDGVFASGDLACWQDGELRLCGRRSQFINVGGRKVDPCEVEAVIATLLGVDEVLVTGRSTKRGTSEACWAIVASAAGHLTRAAVLQHCRQHLAPHKVPRLVTLVDSLPRNNRGKVDLAALARSRHTGARLQ